MFPSRGNSVYAVEYTLTALDSEICWHLIEDLLMKLSVELAMLLGNSMITHSRRFAYRVGFRFRGKVST